MRVGDGQRLLEQIKPLGNFPGGFFVPESGAH
jgi:hypothetical protein